MFFKFTHQATLAIHTCLSLFSNHSLQFQTTLIALFFMTFPDQIIVFKKSNNANEDNLLEMVNLSDLKLTYCLFLKHLFPPFCLLVWVDP